MADEKYFVVKRVLVWKVPARSMKDAEKFAENKCKELMGSIHADCLDEHYPLSVEDA
ncbi:MAG: hypothetical protein WC488_04590 [Candidatus Micrarchaeia archaeon]